VSRCEIDSLEDWAFVILNGMRDFQYFEFVPREPFRKACQEWLARAIERMPRDSTCRAAVTKVKTGYFFSVIIQSSMGTFEAETLLVDALVDRSNRDWQTVALADLERDLLEKLQKWMKSRVMEPKLSVQGDADYDEFDQVIRKAG
jgi:hypothetical protein